VSQFSSRQHWVNVTCTADQSSAQRPSRPGLHWAFDAGSDRRVRNGQHRLRDAHFIVERTRRHVASPGKPASAPDHLGVGQLLQAGTANQRDRRGDDGAGLLGSPDWKVIIGLTLAVLVALLIMSPPRRWSEESRCVIPSVQRLTTHRNADMGRRGVKRLRRSRRRAVSQAVLRRAQILMPIRAGRPDGGEVLDGIGVPVVTEFPNPSPTKLCRPPSW
jgi:hypothetical protein